MIPLSDVADVKIVEGPAMIKSENGLLLNYVTLNVRGRDIVGFVDEAQRVVAREGATCRKASTSNGAANSSTRCGPPGRCGLSFRR